MGRLTARNERQARLWGFALYGEALNPEDVREELEACCSDREALAKAEKRIEELEIRMSVGAREFLRQTYAAEYPGWNDSVAAFLKRTDPNP